MPHINEAVQNVKRLLLCAQSSPDVASPAAKDTVSPGGTETAGGEVAMTTAAVTTTVAMAADTAAAAAFFDAVEDSDSSASSDILQMTEVCAS